MGSILVKLPFATHSKDLQVADRIGVTPSRVSKRDQQQRLTKLTNSCGDAAVKRRPGVSPEVGNAMGDERHDVHMTVD